MYGEHLSGLEPGCVALFSGVTDLDYRIHSQEPLDPLWRRRCVARHLERGAGPQAVSVVLAPFLVKEARNGMSSGPSTVSYERGRFFPTTL